MIGGSYVPVVDTRVTFANPNEVTQLHLALTRDPTEMRVMFTTADKFIPSNIHIFVLYVCVFFVVVVVVSTFCFQS
jgi:hypothetical protein